MSVHDELATLRLLTKHRRVAAAALRDAVDVWKRQIVVARDAGATWAEIGEVIGTTPQAAWKNYQGTKGDGE